VNPGKETRQLAAEAAGFGNETTYRQARKVTEEAIPELVDAMDKGEISISAAAKLTTAEPAIQQEAAANPKKAIELAKKASASKVKDIKEAASEDTRRKREAKEEKREARREENRAILQSVPSMDAIQAAKFSTIVIDPPWDWGDEGDHDQLGRARPDYATMSLDQLHNLQIGDRADEDAHIYLWITNRSLPKGFELLQSWGFRYITCLTWVKPSFGMGNYFRGQTEQVLFGVKGSQPLKRKDAPTVFHAPRGPNGHSSKPIEFYDFVESCSPGPYLEVFSRNARDGWTVWGESYGVN
jgi:N6-adenosine-specific RNA methylase IME4